MRRLSRFRDPFRLERPAPRFAARGRVKNGRNYGNRCWVCASLMPGFRSRHPLNHPPRLSRRHSAFEALWLRDYARIELRVEMQVIEVNPDCHLDENAEFAR